MAAILRIKDENGNWIDIPAIVGPQGPAGEPGAKGDPGRSYTITDADYEAIAAVVLSKMTNAEEVAY